MHSNLSRLLLLVFIILFGLTPGYCQLLKKEKETNTSGHILSLKTSYGVFLPFGDLRDRFGHNFRLAGGLDFLRANGFGISLDLGFIFGSNVREDVLAPFRNQDGILIGLDGQPASIFLKTRGAQLGLQLYKIFPVISPQNGPKIGLGGGIMAHKIAFQEEGNTIPLFDSDLVKGLDRLTRGMYINQELGWAVHSKEGLVNGSVSLEAIEGFTKAVRKEQFDTGPTDPARRLDIYLGIKVNWKIPFYRQATTEEIIYY